MYPCKVGYMMETLWPDIKLDDSRERTWDAYTASVLLHSDSTICWPSSHARFTAHWPSAPTQTPYLSWDLHPCDQMRRSSWDPTTQHTLLGRITLCTLTGTYAVYTPSGLTVFYLAVKQKQLSWVKLCLLLTYCKVPAEFNKTAWIESILSQRHYNICTLCLVFYCLLCSLVHVQWRFLCSVHRSPYMSFKGEVWW